MTNIEDLQKDFIIDSSGNISNQFKKIAEELFNHYAIKTHDDKIYRFTDIEFYYYCSSHRDIITHPRNSEPLTWFINDFGGIDLNFKSRISRNEKGKYILNNEAFFGGILIRQLETEDHTISLKGPKAVAELFRIMDPCNRTNYIPQIIPFKRETSVNIEGKKRWNLVNPENDEAIARKVKNILYQYDKEESDFPENLDKDFKEHIDSLYRYKIE